MARPATEAEQKRTAELLQGMAPAEIMEKVGELLAANPGKPPAKVSARHYFTPKQWKKRKARRKAEKRGRVKNRRRS